VGASLLPLFVEIIKLLLTVLQEVLDEKPAGSLRSPYGVEDNNFAVAPEET
jgi:hypothetical protein